METIIIYICTDLPKTLDPKPCLLPTSGLETWCEKKIFGSQVSDVGLHCSMGTSKNLGGGDFLPYLE